MISFFAKAAANTTQIAPLEGMPEWALQLVGLVVGAYTTVEVVKAIVRGVTGRKNGNGNGKGGLLTRIISSCSKEQKEEPTEENLRELMVRVEELLKEIKDILQ